ncbi:hypothetical protein [Ignavibacterium sp.]|uniref:hypothetical protein n=1 Tax=Ignavibacterium sp. TaxID=2651167 RepID=UPI00307CF63F
MKWFAIFKTGKHTDSNGITKDWTEADIDNIVSSYDPSKHEAPIVIGHPKDNSPAFGWIDKLKRIGDTLYALPRQLVNDFVEMINKGMFKKRSISLYPDGTLRHVGFLGATPPAVKGLPDVEFKDIEKDTNIELPGMNDYEEDQNTNDDEVINHLKKKLNEYADQINNNKEKLLKLAEYEQKLKEAEILKSKITELEMQRQQAVNNFNELKAKMESDKFDQFINKSISEGKLLPKMVPIVKKLWECNLSRDVFEFGDKTKSTPNEILVEFIESMPKIIDLGGSTDKGSDGKNDEPSSKIIADEIRKQMNQ